MATASAEVSAEAFRRLYPDQYLERFIQKGVRPDGRPLAQSRPTSIGLGVVSVADASALVKVGSTTVLAGIKCEVMPAPDDAPDEGRLAIQARVRRRRSGTRAGRRRRSRRRAQRHGLHAAPPEPAARPQVELPPLCSADSRPGRPAEAAALLSEQLAAVVGGGGVVDLRQLCIDPGRAAWAVYADLYVLDADGSLHDACLLALLAALASLRLHAVAVDESGRVHRAEEGGGGAPQQGAAPAAAGTQQAQRARRLTLGCQPASLTCGLYRGRLVADPTAEEEPLMGALLTATLDEAGGVLGLCKAGGAACASRQQVQECVEAARLRGAEVRALLRQALEAADAAAAAG